MKTPEQIFNEAFDCVRDPRSDAYKAGVMAALRFRIDGARIESQWAPGTAQADAFFSGLNEGHALWRAQEGASC